MGKYWQLIQQFGPELTILIETPINKLSSGNIPGFAEAIHHVRKKIIHKKTGFDGVFGTITVDL
jgi:PHP family Zn ribbon phosphoesterase